MPLGVVFGLLSVLQVQVLRVGRWLVGQSGYRATGRWRRLAVGLYVRIDSQRRAAFTAERRECSIDSSEAVIGITWARV